MITNFVQRRVRIVALVFGVALLRPCVGSCWRCRGFKMLLLSLLLLLLLFLLLLFVVVLMLEFGDDFVTDSDEKCKPSIFTILST
jgi:hypothetical protein